MVWSSPPMSWVEVIVTCAMHAKNNHSVSLANLANNIQLMHHLRAVMISHGIGHWYHWPDEVVDWGLLHHTVSETNPGLLPTT